MLVSTVVRSTRRQLAAGAAARVNSSIITGVTSIAGVNMHGGHITRMMSSAQPSTPPPAQQDLTIVEDSGDGIRTITLNTPRKANALSLAMIEELIGHVQSTADDVSVKMLILNHTGKIFCAGHDLKELKEEAGGEMHKLVFDRCADLMNFVQDMPTPVMAEVNGIATAAGCQLVATCDLAVCSNNSLFATPGSFVGLFCSTPGVAVARAMHRKHAMEMLLTGRNISASEAFNFGLVNRVVPAEALRQTSLDIAQQVVRHSSTVVKFGKACFNKQVTQDRRSAYVSTSAAMVENLTFDDAREGIGAFFDKRKPTWKG